MRAPAADTAGPTGRISVYRYSVLRGVPQSYLRHALEKGVLVPALDGQGRLDAARADALLVKATRAGSRLGRAVRHALQVAGASEAGAAAPTPVPAPTHPSRQRRRWQMKPLPDPDADLPAPVRQAQDHLRQRDFAVVRQADGRFKVEAELLTAAELVARSTAMRNREASLRARRLGRVPTTASAVLPAAPAVTPSAGGPALPPSHRGRRLGYACGRTCGQDLAGQVRRLRQAGAREVFTDEAGGDGPDRPGLAALLALARRGDALSVVGLDRLGRSLAELLAIVATLERRGLALVSLEEGLDTAAAGAAGPLVFRLFEAVARFEHARRATRIRTGLAAARARGRRLGRKPLDEAKAAAVALVAAGVPPGTAAQRVGLGRATVYRAVGRAGLERGT